VYAATRGYSGIYYIDAVSPRLALRLAGLRGVQSAGGSPGKAFTPQPGDTPGFIHRRGFPPGSRCA
ncbi:TPA: hypothetical protein ACWL1B_003614, partial [Klebsiella michiganensis]